MKMRESLYKHYIKKELTRRCERNPRYSLRAFSKSIGFEASVISQILSGKRLPSFKTAERLVRGLALSPAEEKQFMHSVAEVQSEKSKKRFKSNSSKTVQNETQHELSLDLFRIIADLYHYAILALTQTEKFVSDPCWISTQLGISPMEAKLGVERLVQLGFLYEENGTLVLSRQSFTTKDKHLTNSALQRHQRQVLEKAIVSLENDPIENRSMTSMTMAIDPGKISAAKKIIEEFTQRLSTFLESGRQTQVYQLGISLYPIKRREKPCT